MASEYRRTIDELATRYRFEPDLRDIYVEGDTDRAVLEWFVSGRGLEKVAIYRINTVKLTQEAIEAVDVPGHRGKVIALSCSLDSLLPAGNNSLVCLVDKDLDEVFDRMITNRFLWYTDFTCLEMYAATPEALQKFFSVYVRVHFPDQIRCDLESILRKAFVIRATRDIVVPDAAWVALPRCCELRRGRATFSADDYIERLLNSSGNARHRDRFQEEMAELAARLSPDVRENMHGHDFLELLAWYGSRMGAGTICAEKPFKRAFFASMDSDSLVRYRLFLDLIKWGSMD